MICAPRSALLALLLAQATACAPEPAPATHPATEVRLADGPPIHGSIEAVLRSVQTRARWVHHLLGTDGPVLVHTPRRMRAVFGEVVSLEGTEGAEWHAELDLVGYGRAGNLAPVGPPTLQAWGDTITLKRGPIDEWYVNRGTGLEQGFTLQSAPSGLGPIVLELALSGDLHPTEAASELTLVDDSGTARLHVTKLEVADADGRPLPSWFEYDCAPDCAIRIAFDDAGARWPVTVDPLYSAPLMDLTGGFGTAGFAGLSVDIHDDRAIVGVPGDPQSPAPGAGDAYILARNTVGADDWQVEAVLSGGPGFGREVAISGTLAAVGSPGGADQVRVYEWDGTAWSTNPVQLSENGRRFGSAIDLTGDFLAIGAPDDGPSGLHEGEVFLYRRCATGWCRETTLLDPAPGTGRSYGAEILLDGTTAFIGIPSNQGPGEVEQWTRDPLAATWSQTQTLAAGTPEVDGFGTAIARVGNHLAIGAPDRGNGEVHRGRLDRLPTFPDETVAAPTTSTAFGTSLASDGHGLAISSLETSTTGPGARVWLHEIAQDSLLLVEAIEVPSAQLYAPSVAMDGDTLVIGTPEADATMGGISLFRRESDSWSIASFDPGIATSGSLTGLSIAMEDDWMAVGQPGDDTLAVSAGQVVVLQRDQTVLDGWALSAVLTDGAPTAFDQYGSALAIGDGLLAVGYHDSTVSANAGAVQVWTLQDLASPLYSVPADLGTTQFGAAVAIDGTRLVVTQLINLGTPLVRLYHHDDLTNPTVLVETAEAFGTALALGPRFLAVGAPLEDGAGTDRGMVHFYGLPDAPPPASTGTATGTATGTGTGTGGYTNTPRITWLDSISGAANGDEFGRALAWVDGDTVMISAPGRNGGGFTDGGLIRGFSWNGTGFASSTSGFSGAQADSDRMGWSMAADGDRLVVGTEDTNRVTIHERNLGGADAWGVAVTPVPVGLQPSDQFGFAVAISGSTVAAGSPVFSGADGRVTVIEADATLGPVAIEDDFVGTEDGVLAGNVLANDFDPSGSILGISSTSTPASGGGFSLDFGTGDLTWTPPPNFNGQDQFTYQLSGVAAPTTVTLTVNAVNDAPVGQPDYFAVDEDPVSPLAGNVLGNDSDVEGTPLQAIELTPPTSGLLVLDPFTGDFTYQPDPDFNGADSFEYQPFDLEDLGAPVTVQITVNPVNDPPVGAPPYAAQTLEDTPLAVDAANGLLVGATDPDGDLYLTTRIVSDGPLGVTTIQPDGSYTFDPTVPDANGMHAVSFEIVDSVGAAAQYQLDLWVEPVNDAPLSADDAYPGTEGTQLNINALGGVLSNDSDTEGTALVATVVTATTAGLLTLNTDGSFQYVPNQDFFGIDSFTYVATDAEGLAGPVATVILTISGVPDPPVALSWFGVQDEDTAPAVAPPGLLTGASDADGDSISVVTTPISGPTSGSVILFANGGFTYTPDPNFNGDDSFVFEVTDGGLSSQASAFITVNPVNDAPVATDDAYQVDEDSQFTPFAPGVVANDTDIEDATVLLTGTWDPASGPTLGSISNFAADGSFEYTPGPDLCGPDSFEYDVADTEGAIDRGVVNITVVCIPDPPIAIAEPTYLVGVDPLVVAPPGVLTLDYDPDGDSLSAILVTTPTNGLVTLDPDGGFTYTPDPGYVGADSFSYQASDGVLVSYVEAVSLDVDATTSDTGDTGDTGFTTGTGTGTGTGGTDTGECPTWYPDLDGDGFGDDLGAIEACDQPAGTVAEGGDCNDGDADVFPGAEEFADDGIDQDCDGEDAILEAGKGCGCSSGGGSSSWLLLALPLLALRRRQ